MEKFEALATAKNSPWTGTMADGPPTLLKELCSQVSQPAPTTHGGDVCTRIHSHTVHALEVHHQMTILATQAEGGIAVAAALGAHLQAEPRTARHGGLDVLGSGWYGKCSGRVSQSLVEGQDVVIPGAVGLNFVGYAGRREAVSDGCSWE